MHVSYRKAVGLFAITPGHCALTKSVHAGRTFVVVPPKTLVCQQPNSPPSRKTHIQIDLFSLDFIKSPESTWEIFWPPRGPPRGAQGPPGEPQEPPRDLPGLQQSPRSPPEDLQGTTRRVPGDPRSLTSNSQRAHIELTSNAHRIHIKLTWNSHRTHIKLTSNSQRDQPISQHVSGVELPIARLWRPVC